MEQRIPEQFVPLVRDVVHELVLGTYAGLVSDGRAADWPPEVLEDTVAQIERRMGAPLIDLPDAAFDRPAAVPLEDGSGWGIDIRLWTAKGPSLYTLVLDIDTSGDEPAVHIEQLEIM
jgi:hypothetical protein